MFIKINLLPLSILELFSNGLLISIISFIGHLLKPFILFGRKDRSKAAIPLYQYCFYIRRPIIAFGPVFPIIFCKGFIPPYLSIRHVQITVHGRNIHIGVIIIVPLHGGQSGFRTTVRNRSIISTVIALRFSRTGNIILVFFIVLPITGN